jgi:hypothetical protein
LLDARVQCIVLWRTVGRHDLEDDFEDREVGVRGERDLFDHYDEEHRHEQHDRVLDEQALRLLRQRIVHRYAALCITAQHIQRTHTEKDK